MIRYEGKDPVKEKKKAGVLWKLLTVAILIALGVWIAGVSQKRSVEERAYEAALELVKKDLDPWPVSFQPFDQKYVVQQSDGHYNIEVQVETKNRYGMKKQYVYDVEIQIEKGNCLPVLCMRRL